MISYKPLWHTLINKGLKKTELQKMIKTSSRTLAKMQKNEYIGLETIDRICEALNCRIEDIIEYVEKDKMWKA